MTIPQYTDRVGKRADLARKIRTAHLAAAQAEGLTEADLKVIEDEGAKAREADRLQHEQVALNAVRRSERARTADALLSVEEGKIRDRLPLVIHDLGGTPLAAFFTRLSFARYRIREHDAAAPSAAPAAPAAGAPATTPAEDDEVRSVERVEKQDVITRLQGLASLCAAILRPGREAAVKAFEARKLSAADIAAIGKEAEAFVKEGKNSNTAADAAATEGDAVRAQRAAWNASRRVIKKVASPDAELARLLAEC